MTWSEYSNETAEVDVYPGPPTALAVLIFIVTFLSLFPLISDSTMLSWIGYALAAWVVALLTISYREVDRRRESDPMYLPKPRLRTAVHIAAISGLLIGCLHAWKLAQERSFA